jgi:hypothetical protein
MTPAAPAEMCVQSVILAKSVIRVSVSAPVPPAAELNPAVVALNPAVAVLKPVEARLHVARMAKPVVLEMCVIHQTWCVQTMFVQLSRRLMKQGKPALSGEIAKVVFVFKPATESMSVLQPAPASTTVSTGGPVTPSQARRVIYVNALPALKCVMEKTMTATESSMMNHRWI